MHLPVRLRAVAAAAAVALAGCATAPPDVAPLAGVGVPAAWAQSLPAATGGSADGTLADWWLAFGDPLLIDLVRQALRANTEVGIARANLRQARAARAQAAAVLWPGLTASGSARRGRSAGAGSDQNRFEAALDAGWEADLFGANRHGVAAQDALVRAGAANLGATQVSVAAEVALAYLDLRSAQVRTAVARENLASQEETLQISRWRQQAGLASSLEVEQALGAVEQTRAQVPALQAAAAQAAHALAVLTGQPPVPQPALSAAAPVPQPQLALAVHIPAETLRRRPDVLAAEQRLRAAAAEVAQADALRRPTIELGASLAWSGLTLGSLGSVAAARSLLASMAQPLFDGGRRGAQLAGSRAAFEAAQEGYRASVLAALQDVEDALVALAADRERLASLRGALVAARNASLLATQRHASGLIDFQVVLETQRTLLSVQDSVASLEAAVAAGHVRLYKALGGGWTPPENLS